MEKVSLLALFFIVSLRFHQVKSNQCSVTDTSQCTFPFTYNGKMYSSCINMGRSFPWCSLTTDFMQIWDYCCDLRYPDDKCASDCQVDPNDATGYKKCTTESGKKMYCVQEILPPQPRSGSCSEAYSKMSPYHTACLPASRYVAKTGIPKELIPILEDMHNKYRRNLSPAAAEMMKLHWDDNLALLAQRHAERCSFAHDEPYLRQLPGSATDTGQNIVMITGMDPANFTYAFETMFDGEKERFEHGNGLTEEFKRRGLDALHYTQILLESMTLFGCGYAECVYPHRVERIFACDYNFLQNQNDVVTPYRAGSPCEACPERCDNGLCDCGKVACFNGAKLNKRTCKCECQGLWRGERCEIEIRQQKDPRTGCWNPFLWNGQVIEGCISIFGPDTYQCSIEKELKDDPNVLVDCPGPMGPMENSIMKRSHHGLGHHDQIMPPHMDSSQEEEEIEGFVMSPSEVKKVRPKHERFGHKNSKRRHHKHG